MKRFFDTRQNLVSVLLAVALIVTFLYQFTPFIFPIILAAVFAFALEPKIKRFRRKRSKKVPTLLILILFSLVFVAPVVFTFYRIAKKVTDAAKGGFQNIELFQALEKLKDKLLHFVTSYNPSIAETLGDGTEQLGKLSEKVLAATGAAVAGLPDLTVSFFMFLISTYFFIVYSKDIKENVRKLKLLHEDRLDRLIISCQKVCYGTLVTSIIVGAIQASIVTIGARIVGYKDFILIFIMTFFFSFIPVIGAGPVAVVLSLNSFIIGDTADGVVLLGVAGIAGSIDNFIKPYILTSSGSDEEDVNPIISILAFVGAVLVFGIPGLVIGPVLTQLAIILVPILLTDVGLVPRPDPSPRILEKNDEGRKEK